MCSEDWNLKMFVDKSFFCFSRTGNLDGIFDYPGIIDTTDKSLFKSNADSNFILGKEIKKYSKQTYLEPGSADIVELDDILVVRNAPYLLQHSSSLVDEMMKIHSRYGYAKLIYGPGLSDPYLIPALVYLGFSIFDDILLRKLSADHFKITPFGYAKAEGDPFEANLSYINEEMRTIRRAIENRTLRELVEKYIISGKVIEIIRNLDNKYADQQISVFPRVTPFIRANEIFSIYRPDLLQYRKKIANNYVKPEGRDILLLLPCSARKPYSSSRSHQRIIETLSGLRESLHEMIVTSPIGLVPRELESIYPAAFYDIPVIGQWFEDEKKMISTMLKSYLKRNKYERIIAFLPEDLIFVKEVLPEGSIFIEGRSGRQSDLSNLREAVFNLTENRSRRSHINERYEELRSVAMFQFGNWIEPYLEDTRAIRSYNQDMLTKAGKVCIVFNRSQGKETITREIAPAFLENRKFLVEIDDFKPTANIYPVGILSSTDDIGVEDEVVVVHNGEIRGVGVSKMPSVAIRDLKKGVAVKMRN
ncbi:MAG: DUF5591 domain-containing protein [Candidatus Thermoplasmatota archaeon]|nr:DUF5591 domain-containing protein [Candidatus Thermoplasmatota archaeon]